jgi:separase
MKIIEEAVDALKRGAEIEEGLCEEIESEVERLCVSGEEGEVGRSLIPLVYFLGDDLFEKPCFRVSSFLKGVRKRRLLEKYSLRYFSGESCSQESRKRADGSIRRMLPPGFVSYLKREVNASPAVFREGDEFVEDGQFLEAYSFLLSGKYLESLEISKDLLVRSQASRCKVFVSYKLHLLSLASCAAYRLGQFQDAVYFCHLGIGLCASVGFMGGTEYFREALCVVEMDGGVSTTSGKSGLSLLSLISEKDGRAGLQDKIYRSKRYSGEVSLLREVRVHDNRERARVSVFPVGDSIREFARALRDGAGLCAGTVFVYDVEGRVVIGAINRRGKLSVVESDVDSSSLLFRMKMIHQRNKEVLRRACESSEQKRAWWKERNAMDSEIKEILQELDNWVSLLKKHGLLETEMSLVVEGELGTVPFEMCGTFRSHGVARAPSLGFLLSEGAPVSERVDFSKCFYILDPEDNLPETRRVVEEFVGRELGGVRGMCGRICTAEELEESLEMVDTLFYFGHGGGEKYFTFRQLRKFRSVPKRIFLFGCSSSRIVAPQNYNVCSTALSYLFIPGVRSVIGCLWDVTDKDLDMLSLTVMREMKRGKESLPRILGEARRQCKLKYLNGASVVLYGSADILELSGKGG